MRSRYPIYIVSKGRWESRLTVKALDQMGQPYHIVVEPQEFEQYAKVIDSRKILTLPFSNLGQGSIPARNWIWEHALSTGAKRHWILDDNIAWFARTGTMHKKVRVVTPACFRAVEDFADRYTNVALAGMQYEMFTPSRQHFNPFILNTRIYSCILILNRIPYRWRGRYNEDTDLSLCALKDGWCTLLVQAFICKKISTMVMKGGNTDELYKGNGRLLMAQELQRRHPDVTTISWRWGRPQHVVDYSRFKANRLVPRRGLKVQKGPNNYGLVLKRRST